MDGDLRFSVVVPTRDRPGSLARCLHALESQDIREPFEIVVVDDGSVRVDETAAVVAGHPCARLVQLPASGSVAARNRGVRDARAAVVLLVDDDCEPRPEWAGRLLARLDDTTYAVAGRCLNTDRSDVLGEATQVVLDYLTLESANDDGYVAFAPTYNLACRRSLLLDLPFDARYVNSGADRDWCLRLTNDGRRIALEPRALVDHRQLPGLRRFWRKHRAYGAGSALYHRRHAVGMERPSFYTGLLRAGFRRGFRVGLAVCLAQTATAVGYAGMALALRRPDLPSLASEQRLSRGDDIEPESNAHGRGDVGYTGTTSRRART